MFKLLFLAALLVGGVLIVRRILSDDGVIESDLYYGAPEPSQPAS